MPSKDDEDASYGLDREYQAKKLFQTTFKKRYLGDMSAKYEYIPSQPIIGLPVDVDGWGFQTIKYRPKSAKVILEEQHKAIHRNSTSRPNSARKSPRLKSPRPSSSIRSVVRHNSLSIGPPSAEKPSSTGYFHISQTYFRPQTGHSTRSIVSSRSNKSVSSSVDSEYLNIRSSCKDTDRRIKNQRSEVNHSLKNGFFVRGKNKTPDQFLTFGGGVKNSAGMIDSFSVMQTPEQFYQIEGGSGTVVAKTLRKQDKVLIGRNGVAVPKKRTLMDEINEQRAQEVNARIKEFEFALTDEVSPLCIDDSVNAGAKVITPSAPKTKGEGKSLCESHPVVFRKLISDDSRPSKSAMSDASVDRYKLTHRSKTNVGIGGKENIITVINFESDVRPEFDSDRQNIDDLTLNRLLKESPKEDKTQAEVQTIQNEIVEEVITTKRIHQNVTFKNSEARKGVSSAPVHSHPLNVSRTSTRDAGTQPDARLPTKLQPQRSITSISDMKDKNLIVVPKKLASNNVQSQPVPKQTHGKLILGKPLSAAPKQNATPETKNLDPEFIKISKRIAKPEMERNTDPQTAILIVNENNSVSAPELTERAVHFPLPLQSSSEEAFYETNAPCPSPSSSRPHTGGANDSTKVTSISNIEEKDEFSISVSIKPK